MKITLRQMAVFDTIARLGSVSHAAQELSLTQSATSMALGDMERLLGVQLFERRGKFTLNEHGRRLRPRIRSVLLLAREIESSVGDASPEGALRIGASTMIGSYLLPQICAHFVRQHPGARVNLRVSSTIDVVRRVDDMTIDLGFVEASSLRPTLRVIRWMDDRLVLFCGAGHPLAHRKRIHARDLNQEPWCLQPIYSLTRATLTRALLAHGNTLKIVLETNNIEAIKRAVKAGLGIGCLSAQSLGLELKDGSLHALSVQGLPLKTSLNIILRGDIQHGALHEAFINEAVRFYAQSPDERRPRRE